MRYPLCLLFSVLAAAPLMAAPTAQSPLSVADGRMTTLTQWVPRDVRGVVLFSTGHGSWPERYDAVASAWKAAGFAVIAPLHVDSLHSPDQARFTREASFGARIADLRAASAFAARTWPGKPVIAAGHSFGTLIALCLGGGLAQVGKFRDPSVRAVLGFSSPGRIPGLIGPRSYATDALPVMILTGDRDVVPGLVRDWRDHLLPVRTAPAGHKYGVVYRGATHDLVGHPADPGFAAAVATSTAFLRAYALRDAAAARMLNRRAGAGQAIWIRR